MIIQLVLPTLALNAYFTCLNAWLYVYPNYFSAAFLSREWDFSYSGTEPRSSADGIDVSPLGESCSYTPKWDVPQHASVNADWPMGFSRSSCRNRDPLWRDLPRSEIGLCYRNFPLLEAGFVAPWRDVLLLRSKCESNSVVEIFPSWKLNHGWDFPHLETIFTGTVVGLTTTWELHTKSIPDISESK